MTFLNATYVGEPCGTFRSTTDAQYYSTSDLMNKQWQRKADEDGYLVCRFSNRKGRSKAKFDGSDPSDSLTSDVKTSTEDYCIPVASFPTDNGNSLADDYRLLHPDTAQYHSGNSTRIKTAELICEHDPSTVEGTEDEEKYWEPASTEEELYGQLENRKFRHIKRRDVTDRKEIGSGEFGVVEKARWQMSKDKKIVVAVKTLSGTSGNEDSIKFLREATINGQFRHRNVVRLHGVVIVGSPLMLVLEFMSKGDLKAYLVKQRQENTGQPYPRDFPFTLLQMCRDIAHGMEYLSKKSFVHRDLAARNILLNKQLICKIGDFGMARDVSDDNYYITKGGRVPVRWCAPETWNYKKFSSASDVWSYGVLLYEIWSVGQRPFGLTSNQKVMTKVEDGYRLPPPPGCSRCLYHLMIDCWNPDRHERPSFGNILQRLAAPDKSLTTNGQREPNIVGSLGDELDVSTECYKDLQEIYGWE
jgi:ephrin-B